MTSLSDWLAQLKPASFRGVRFAVDSNEGQFGRRGELHEYPYRDRPWFEDTGRAARRISIRGSLISNSHVYGGGSAIDQKEKLIAAVEQMGPATLVHPTLGNLTVDSAALTITDSKWAQCFDFTLTCVEAGLRVFPSAQVSTTTASKTAATNLNTAASSDFSAKITPALGLGALSAQQALATVQGWTAQVGALAADATSLYRLAVSLPGNFGRFAAGALIGGLGAAVPSVFSAATTIGDLIGAASSARSLVNGLISTAQTTAQDLGTQAASASPDDLAGAAQSLVSGLASACADPADAVRELTNLAGFAPVLPPSTIQGAIGDLMRRAAVSTLVQASTAYQPASYNDAASLRASICGLIDNELDVAGDQDDDASFSALLDLRQGVVADLTARGASLSQIATFNFNASRPVIALSHALYQDATRADGLLTQIGDACPHPLFAPTIFQALAQ